MNCGTIDFIVIIGQNSAMNAVASGIIAGNIVRKIGEHGVYPHPHYRRYDGEHHGHKGHTEHRDYHHYQVGITLQDGSQQVIIVPNASDFQQDDHIQLIDGRLMHETPVSE